MSHSSGTVKFEDGTVMYFEYDGTSDVARPLLYNTPEEVSENWRCEISQDKYVDSATDEEKVEILANYGGGIEWTGTASRSLMILTGNLIPEQYRHEQIRGIFGIGEI